LFSDRASLAIPCGVWVGKMGKGDLAAPETELAAGGGLKLSGSMRRSAPEPLVEHGSASPGA